MSGATFQALLGMQGKLPVYTTWNPSDKAAGITLSNGNLTAAGPSGTTYNQVRSVLSLPSNAKVYMEFVWGASPNNSVVGLCPDQGTHNINLTTGSPYPGGTQTLNEVGYFCSGGAIINNDSNLFTLSSAVAGSVINLAYDGNTGKVWIGFNGTWANSGNPAAGTGQVITLTNTIYVCCAMRGSSALTANFGASAFSYTVPSGFLAGLYS